MAIVLAGVLALLAAVPAPAAEPIRAEASAEQAKRLRTWLGQTATGR